MNPLARFIALLLCFVFVPTFKGWGQTSPPPGDPNIEVRWIYKSWADREKELGNVLGENALNIFVLAEGFTGNSKNSFFEFANEQADFFIESVPLSNHFNIFLVYLPSLEEGVDVPGRGIERDTALDSIYIASDGTLELNDYFLPFIYLKSISERDFSEERDFIVVLVNAQAVNISALDSFQEYLTSLTLMDNGRREVPSVMTHELGHQIASLADEYRALGQGKSLQMEALQNSNGELREINLWGSEDYLHSVEEDFIPIPREIIPWGSLIRDEVPLPTGTEEVESPFSGKVYYPLEEFYEVTGLFGDYHILYAPTNQNCLMNWGGRPEDPNNFCPVCANAWRVRILGETFFLVGGPMPNGRQASMDSGILRVGEEIALDLIPSASGYEVAWLVDGVREKVEGSKFQVESGNLLEVVVTDIAMRESIKYNPYNDYAENHPGSSLARLSGTTSRFYTEIYDWEIRRAENPLITPTPTPKLYITIIENSIKEAGIFFAWEWPYDEPLSFNLHIYTVPLQRESFLKQTIVKGDQRTYLFTPSKPGKYAVAIKALGDGWASPFSSFSKEAIWLPSDARPSNINITQKQSESMQINWNWEGFTPDSFVIHVYRNGQFDKQILAAAGFLRSFSFSPPNIGTYRFAVMARYNNNYSRPGWSSNMIWNPSILPTPTPSPTPIPRISNVVLTKLPSGELRATWIFPFDPLRFNLHVYMNQNTFIPPAHLIAGSERGFTFTPSQKGNFRVVLRAEGNNWTSPFVWSNEILY